MKDVVVILKILSVLMLFIIWTFLWLTLISIYYTRKISDEVKENMLTSNMRNKTQMTHIYNSSEYYQEIAQSQTADKPMAPQGRA